MPLASGGVTTTDWPRQRRPGVFTLLRRGLFRQCPWCGKQGAFIRGWFHKHPRCRRCGLAWQREVGFEVGALAVNTILVFGVIIVAMVVWFVLTWPDIPILPMLLALGAVAIVAPIVIYPISYTLWQAVELIMRPPTPADFGDPSSPAPAPNPSA